jgi:hypothetical protein
MLGTWVRSHRSIDHRGHIRQLYIPCMRHERCWRTSRRRPAWPVTPWTWRWTREPCCTKYGSTFLTRSEMSSSQLPAQKCLHHPDFECLHTYSVFISTICKSTFRTSTKKVPKIFSGILISTQHTTCIYEDKAFCFSGRTFAVSALPTYINECSFWRSERYVHMYNVCTLIF